VYWVIRSLRAAGSVRFWALTAFTTLSGVPAHLARSIRLVVSTMIAGNFSRGVRVTPWTARSSAATGRSRNHTVASSLRVSELRLHWSTGTADALYWIDHRGWIPGRLMKGGSNSWQRRSARSSGLSVTSVWKYDLRQPNAVQVSLVCPGCRPYLRRRLSSRYSASAVPVLHSLKLRTLSNCSSQTGSG